MNKEQQLLEFMRLHSNLENAITLYYKFSKKKELRKTIKTMLGGILQEHAAFMNKYIKLK